MLEVAPSPERWISGETVESLVAGFRVSVKRESRNNWVHVELAMRSHGVDVVSGKIVLSPETWDVLVGSLPAPIARDAERSFVAEGVRVRGLDFDSTLSLSRQALTNRVVIGLKTKPMPRASCSVETVVDDASWMLLVAAVLSGA